MPSIPLDPTAALFAAARGYVAAYQPGRVCVRVIVYLEDGSPALDARVAPGVAIAQSPPQQIADEQEESPFVPFVPSPFQQAILAALDGKAMRTDALGAAVGDRARLFKKAGLNELRERGLVDHHERVGFFRPDAPPQSLS